MGTTLKGKNLLPEGAYSFLYEQIIIVWKITFITLSYLPWVLLFLLRTCIAWVGATPMLISTNPTCTYPNVFIYSIVYIAVKISTSPHCSMRHSPWWAMCGFFQPCLTICTVLQGTCTPVCIERQVDLSKTCLEYVKRSRVGSKTIINHIYFILALGKFFE